MVKMMLFLKVEPFTLKSSAQFTLENYTFNNNFEDDHVEQYTML